MYADPKHWLSTRTYLHRIVRVMFLIVSICSLFILLIDYLPVSILQ